jgi:hypothetical protein
MIAISTVRASGMLMGSQCAGCELRWVAGQAEPERAGCLEHRFTAGAADVDRVEEAVEEAAVAPQGDRDARRPEPVSVFLAFVAQRIEAGGGDVGRREPREVVGEQR